MLRSQKFDFGEVEIAMFQVVASHWKLIFFLLTSPKFDLGEMENAKFEGLVSHFELIFGILIIPKCDLVEVEKACLNCTYGTFNIFSVSRLFRYAT